MENIATLCPRKLTRLLERVTDEPVEIDWDETPRQAWAKAEFLHDSVCYRPAREEKRPGAKVPVFVQADAFSAPPSVLSRAAASKATSARKAA